MFDTQRRTGLAADAVRRLQSIWSSKWITEATQVKVNESDAQYVQCRDMDHCSEYTKKVAGVWDGLFKNCWSHQKRSETPLKTSDQEMDQVYSYKNRSSRSLQRTQHIHWNTLYCVWHGGVVVMVMDSRSRGHGFDSRPFHFYVATPGKLFTHMCLCHQAV